MDAKKLIGTCKTCLHVNTDPLNIYSACFECVKSFPRKPLYVDARINAPDIEPEIAPEIEPDSEPEIENIITQPTHYTRWKIEPITFIMRNGFEFWRGNIVKYASRAGYKLYPNQDSVQSEITDLQKVIRYANMRINQLNGEATL